MCRDLKISHPAKIILLSYFDLWMLYICILWIICISTLIMKQISTKSEYSRSTVPSALSLPLLFIMIMMICLSFIVITITIITSIVLIFSLRYINQYMYILKIYAHIHMGPSYPIYTKEMPLTKQHQAPFQRRVHWGPKEELRYCFLPQKRRCNDPRRVGEFHGVHLEFTTDRLRLTVIDDWHALK